MPNGTWTGSGDAVAEQEYALQNAPDCPSCEASADSHVVMEGLDALRGDGIYCGRCETFVTPLSGSLS